MGQRECGCASGNMGVPVGICVRQGEYVCHREYGWARGNMCASGNMGGPEGIGLGNG